MKSGRVSGLLLRLEWIGNVTEFACLGQTILKGSPPPPGWNLFSVRREEKTVSFFPQGK